MEHTPYCSTEITELARAMLKVQADLQPALKDRENTFSHSRYATLNSVMDACRTGQTETSNTTTRDSYRYRKQTND